MKKAIIFDMDGVIIDSETLWGRSFVAFLKIKGIKGEMTWESKRKHAGKTMGETSAIMKREFKLKESVDEITAMRKKELLCLYEKELALEDGFRELMKRFRKRGMKVALATCSPADITNYVIRKLSLSGLFDVVLTGEEVLKGKPNPEIFLLTAKMMGVRPEECIVVEDAPNGVEAARRAGMKCVAFKRPYIKEEDISGADFKINNFSEFREEWVK